jgi:hypothetical protein
MGITMPDTNYVLVPVGRKGEVAAVDEADWERVRWRRWTLQKTPGGNLYAATTLYRGSVGMHRYIMECDDPALVIDHRDGFGLNNRRYNLREATYAQNVMNRAVGVSWVELRRLWRVTVGKDVSYYRDRVAADAALSQKAKEKYGEFARQS